MNVGTSFVSIDLKLEHALKVLINFEKKLPALFIWASSSAAQMIREKLGMHDEAGLYYNPVGRGENEKYWQIVALIFCKKLFISILSDEKHRRITLLPEIISEESKLVLKTLFGEKKVIEELTNKAVYSILAKATPKNVSRAT